MGFHRFGLLAATWAAACAAVGACSPGPAPSLYFLDAAPSPANYTADAVRVGLAEISLPAYARKVQIANRTRDHRIVQDDDHRWAAPPAEAISDALANALEAQLAGPVVPRPYPRGFQPDLRVRVAFDRFLRSDDGAAELAGQYFIIGAADEDVGIRRFQITAAADDESYEAYMRAVADGLGALAADIAASLA